MINLFFLMIRLPPRSALFPYPPLSRSPAATRGEPLGGATASGPRRLSRSPEVVAGVLEQAELDREVGRGRSEEHTSELQSRQYLVCRLLLETKTKPPTPTPASSR